MHCKVVRKNATLWLYVSASTGEKWKGDVMQFYFHWHGKIDRVEGFAMFLSYSSSAFMMRLILISSYLASSTHASFWHCYRASAPLRFLHYFLLLIKLNTTFPPVPVSVRASSYSWSVFAYYGARRRTWTEPDSRQALPSLHLLLKDSSMMIQPVVVTIHDNFGLTCRGDKNDDTIHPFCYCNRARGNIDVNVSSQLSRFPRW
jgi:hypothetical protein